MTALDDLNRQHSSKMLGNANTTRPDEDVQLVEDDGSKKPPPWAQRPVGDEGYRGFPCFPAAGGILGTIDGTDPLQALLDKAEKMGW